jgi:hypothetical protein
MTRISKRVARTMYNNGTPVKIVPNFANLEHPMWKGFYEKAELNGRDFDKLCDDVLYYHYNDGCGRRLAYYIE